MANNPRRFRLPRLYQPGDALGYRDIDILIDKIVKEIRQLEIDKLDTADATAQFSALSENLSVILLASAARTASAQSADQSNPSYSRLLLVVNVSATGGGSITPKLEVKDAISGNYIVVWAAAAPITLAGSYTYYFADGGGGGVFTETAGFGLPSTTWRLNSVANNANTLTYSASGEEMT